MKFSYVFLSFEIKAKSCIWRKYQLSTFLFNHNPFATSSWNSQLSPSFNFLIPLPLLRLVHSASLISPAKFFLHPQTKLFSLRGFLICNEVFIASEAQFFFFVFFQENRIFRTCHYHNFKNKLIQMFSRVAY